MSLPFFFTDTYSPGQKLIVLDEDTSRHIAGVLRKGKGDEILLTDGKGTKAIAVIIDDNKKKCVVEVSSAVTEEKPQPEISIAISLIKNTSRFEWFLEKATEIGITEIIPLLCERTEKEKFRFDRLNNILVSAMLQSKQSWLPVLHQPTTFTDVIQLNQTKQKMIAHCLKRNKRQLSTSVQLFQSSMILIGPEGDFSEKEINAALEKGFEAVALGTTRLRTETAGMVAATLLKHLS
ncbi:MAG TPA: RsmE family RNA methyltransferase [Flavisolibacter sp.]|nr:RsmE family RNA methyltransferase [Flavisolibacter sp.]